MSLASHWRELGARFDHRALRPPATPADEAALASRHPGTRAALRQWCAQGAGASAGVDAEAGGDTGTSALAVGALHGPDTATTRDWADHFARQLDGSLRLEALPGRAAQLGWRLGVKLQDAMWWRARQCDDPWDAGWAIEAPAALQQLQARFLPRRATLVLADARSFDRLRPGLAALHRRRGDFRHPVRWLWVAAGPPLPAGQGLAIARFTLS